jgi:anti-sigma factor RsiW
MNEYDEKWEQQINALLDGELSADDAELLKAEATDDRELARAIVEAYQLQQAMDALRVERAPASLTKKLRAIPRQHRSKPVFSGLFNLAQPRWAAALAAIPLVVIAVSLMRPDTPSAAEVAQARQEMAIAFAYLDKAGVITGREIESTVGRTMANAVTDSVNRTIQSQSLNFKEKEV